MKLSQLNPRFVGAGGSGITDAAGNPVPERTGVGLSFDCPCGCSGRVYVAFRNPLDGGEPHSDGPHWDRTGKTFGDLALSPSIQVLAGSGGVCRWHGYVGLTTPGEVTTC